MDNSSKPGQAREPFTEFMYGIAADALKPKYFATMRKGEKVRTYGPLTCREWAKLIEEEQRDGWEFVPASPDSAQ